MNNANHCNQLLVEFDQIARLIPMLSEKEFGLVIRTLWNRNDKLIDLLDDATAPPRRTLHELLAAIRANKAPLLQQKSAH